MARNTKMPRSLIALSASAVAAVYLAGFGITQGADASLGQAAASSPVAIAASPNPTQATSPAVSVVPTARRQQTAPTPSTSVAGVTATSPAASSGNGSASTAAATTAAYKDGTYTGTGNSRRGGISVSVTVSGGRIGNVQITGSTTEYPTSRISSLPGQVVSKQSAQVNNVSGATYSAQAFQLAVQQALSKAKA